MFSLPISFYDFHDEAFRQNVRAFNLKYKYIISQQALLVK
jgi:hypothetical protein